MPAPDKQLSAEQSRQIADTIREEIARRRISRQSLAELAKLSLSTLEKVLGGRRPFTLATTVRLEQALGVTLRKAADAPAPAAPNGNGDIAPDGLGAYARQRRSIVRLNLIAGCHLAHSRGRFHRPSLCETAYLGASRMIGNVRPPAAPARHG